MSGALVALRGHCVLRRGQDVPSFPRTPFLASCILPSLRSGGFLTKPNTSWKIWMPASLRSDGVRFHPGMPFGFLPESAFSFTGISTLIPSWAAGRPSDAMHASAALL